MKKLMIISSLIILFPVQLRAQDSLSTDYPFLFDVSIKTKVKKAAKFYIFEYSVENKAINKGEILSIQVDLRDTLSHLPDTSGLQFQNSFVSNFFKKMYPLIEGDVTPAGFLSAPKGWYGAYSKFGYAVFSGSPMIVPTETLSGFILESKGLPVIRKAIIKPWFDVEKFFQNLEDPNLTQTFTEMDSLRNMVNYHGLTIGPRLPDSTLSLETFTDTLETFRYRSCEELGWITNKGICNSLQVKLGNVRRHLERGKPKQARNVLNAFIHEVEAQRGKHITEEGYALLYFNAEYLMNKLDSGKED